MRYARFLPEKGTIGFVAPSFGCNIEPYHSAFKHALEVFKEQSYKTKCGPNVYEGSGIGISSTPEKCAEEFNSFYTSPETDVLISCGGGELMCEILDYVDFDRIRESQPKWFMGYSDNTNLTFLLATLCDTAAIYGPCAPTFGMDPWHKNLYDAMDLLTGRSRTAHSYGKWEKESLKTEDQPLMPYNVTEPLSLKYWTDSLEVTVNRPTAETDSPEVTVNRPTAETDNPEVTVNRPAAEADSPEVTVKGQVPEIDSPEVTVTGPAHETDIPEVTMKGRLLGGCLDILTLLCGTRYDEVDAFNKRYEKDGVIWFLEACDLNVFSIRRALWTLSHAGWFKNARGFLIGRPYCYGEEMMGLDQYRAVTDILADFHVPIIMDADIGHLPPMMPLVVGSLAAVKAAGNKLKIEMEYK